MNTGLNAFFNELPTVTGKVHCIGHSLGGAVATLAADCVARNRPNPVRLCTFGAPRVGGNFFARSCTNLVGEENIMRVFHTTDPVPMMPIFPYTHAPTRGPAYPFRATLPMMSAQSRGMPRC